MPSSSSSSSGKKPREIKLLCPSLTSSKVANIVVAWDEHRIDLGSIAGAFGLDPSTLRLNGRFISRGVDLISSSVTWKSLLSFFSSKGLPTGKDHLDALVVTGKLCKPGNKHMAEKLRCHSCLYDLKPGNKETKREDCTLSKDLYNWISPMRTLRGRDSQDFQNGNGRVMESENACSSRGTQLEAISLPQNKKLRESNSGENLKGLCCKRKQLFEDVNLFKKLKINDDKSDIRNKVDDHSHSGSISRSPFTCSYMSMNLKRIREDEAIVAAHHKRIR